MNELQIQNVRGYLGKDGTSYLNLEDVSIGLGFTEIKGNKEYVMWRRVDKYLSDFNFGTSAENEFIPENIFYRLAMKARNATAESFQAKVADEILPSIRKHGGYLTDKKIEEVLLNPDTIIQLATQLKEEKIKRIEAERFNNQIAATENSLLVREVAKVVSKKGVSIGEKRLWNKLRDWGMIFKHSTEPKQEYVDRGYFEVMEGVKESSKGTFSYRTTRVTGKGQVYIIKKLLEEKTV